MINKLKITSLILCISLLGMGQELPSEKTENHRQIEGMNIFIVPPPFFVPSLNFKGFQNPLDQTSMIMAMEIPGPYSEVTKGFNPESMSASGMTLKEKNEIKVAEFDGLVLEIEQAANGLVFSKHILVYGNEQSTTLINGVYLKDSIDVGQRIKESILSTIVDTSLKTDPRASLNYTIDETVGSLKFLSVVGNGLLFNRDLKTPTESEDKATLIIAKSFSQVSIADKKSFCLSRIKKYPDDYSILPDKGINPVAIDELEGFELYATNNDRENEDMYQVILFDKNGDYYIFLGTFLSGAENAIDDLKKIIRTFKRKN